LLISLPAQGARLGRFILNPAGHDFAARARRTRRQVRDGATRGKTYFHCSKARKKMFEKYPPKVIYVSSSRLQCAKNGDFETYKKGTGTAIAYAWFVWEDGYQGDTVVKWIN
jgi:hypothetical protein